MKDKSRNLEGTIRKYCTVQQQLYKMLNRPAKQGQKNWRKATAKEIGTELSIGQIPLKTLLDHYVDRVPQPRKKGQKGPCRIHFIPKKSWTTDEWSVRLAHDMRKSMIKHSSKYNPNVTGDQRVGKAHGSHTVVSVNKPKSNTTISQSELERRLNIVESHIAKLLLFKSSTDSDIKELKTYAQNDNRQINLINKDIKVFNVII